MPSYNRVTVVGNLTRDPELRYLPSGKAVADVGLAINSSWTGEDGQKHEDVDFVDVTVFGRPAKTLCQYMRKGCCVLFEGRLKQERWEDKATGQPRTKLKVVAQSSQFFTWPEGSEQPERRGGGAQSHPPARSYTQHHPAETEDVSPLPQDSDDIPF